MTAPSRRPDESLRLRAWIVVLTLAFAAVAWQQSHRYRQMRGQNRQEAASDVRTSYRNALHAFDFYCGQAQPPEPDCELASQVLRPLGNRRCPRARARLEAFLDHVSTREGTRHPLTVPFTTLYSGVCGELDLPSEPPEPAPE